MKQKKGKRKGNKKRTTFYLLLKSFNGENLKSKINFLLLLVTVLHFSSTLKFDQFSFSNSPNIKIYLQNSPKKLISELVFCSYFEY